MGANEASNQDSERGERQLEVGLDALNSARILAKLAPCKEGECPGCRAPNNLLVVKRDASLRGCEFGSAALANRSDNWLTAWRSGGFSGLREQLQAGSLPATHCTPCVGLADTESLELSPLIRDYGDLPGNAVATIPSTIILEPPIAGSADRHFAEQLGTVLATADSLVIACADPLADHVDEAWLQVVRDASNELRISLRVASTPHLHAIATSCAGLTVATIELCSATADREEIQQLKTAADALGAAAIYRFVLRPEAWHHFLQVTDDCDAAEVELDLRTMTHDGATPLADLDLAQLSIVKTAVAHTCSRYIDDRRPKSMSANTYPTLRAELRALTQRAIAHHGDSSGGEPVTCSLPDNDDLWFHDQEYRDRWLQTLFTHAGTSSVRDWIVELAQSPQTPSPLDSLPWLRALSHKLAWDFHDATAIDALRHIYASDQAARLSQEDATWEQGHSTAAFGGPWAQQLGLPAAPRTPPFPYGEATPPDGTAVLITVLIPSYKHAQYIERTIRSVLAQSYTGFKLLVVDDCSPDETLEVARSVNDPRIEVRSNTDNLGLGNSVLQALASIDTPYVALLNSDDLFHPDRLARSVEILENNDNIQVVTTGLSLVDHTDGELNPGNVGIVVDGLQVFNWVNWYRSATLHDASSESSLFELLLERNFLATSSNLTARTDWLLGKAKTFQNLKYCLDWQIFLDAAQEETLHHIPDALAAYRLHATNTVWFDANKRWAFSLEVNRVLADALEHYVPDNESLTEETAYRLTRAVARNIAANTEADGITVLLNTILDPVALEQHSGSSERIQVLLREIQDAAAATRKARTAEITRAETDEQQRLVLLATRSLLAEIRRTSNQRQLQAEQRIEQATQRIEQATQRIETLKDRLELASKQRKDLRAELKDRRELASKQREDLRAELERRLADVNARLQARRTDLAKTTAQREDLRAELERRLADVNARLQARRTDLAKTTARLSTVQKLLDGSNGRLAAETKKLNEAEAARAEVAKQLASKTEHLSMLSNEHAVLRESSDKKIEQLTIRRKQLVRESNELHANVTRLLTSREYRAGNFIWNKLPLNYMSRRGKKWFNRMVDAKDRVALWASGKFRAPKGRGVAIVSATWQWPIYSHTFVYQEMIALAQAGLEVKLIHWKANDFEQLQPAFESLKSNRIELKPARETHKKDRDYFEQSKPGRLNMLLERISAITGKPIEEIADHDQVLRACTFARVAQLAEASYLHSYFFYDQSFMTLITSWLLEIPRGVSCYADHMLDDYPFKLVGLQIELASVVVATSARIKQELVNIAGAEYSDKIVVKPNGVNGERFPAIDRGERQPEDTFEVISISRLEPKKGLEFMIEAVAELKKRGRKIVVHIVGAVDTSLQVSIDYGSELEHQIKQLDLEHEVILHGMKMHEGMAPLMRRSRAFMAPYVELESGDKDGIPTAMLEALASGLPVVTTDAGSILEIVQDGVQALVVPQRDSKAYADALDKLVMDPSLERQLAKQARKRFDEAFDIKVTERRLHERVAAALQ